MDVLTLIQPDDWHLHLRDDKLMARVVQDSAKNFGRAMVMPNLQPPVVTVEQALAYQDRIKMALPSESSFAPLMTLYLTPDTSVEEIQKAVDCDEVIAVKYYPAGATTNSSFGVKSIEQCFDVLEKMEEVGMPLSIHGEVVDSEVDIFDREKVFIETILSEIITRFPKLKVVLEHITSTEGVDFIKSAPSNIVTTITAHHLVLNRNDLLVGGIKPHYYCLPIVKTEKDRLALVKAAVSGDPKFFLGTDSAPHPVTSKRRDVGAGGIYTAKDALSIYAEVFENEGRLDALENFASVFGSQFYGLPLNKKKVTLVKDRFTVTEKLAFEGGEIIPFQAGEDLSWRLKSEIL